MAVLTKNVFYFLRKKKKSIYSDWLRLDFVENRHTLTPAYESLLPSCDDFRGHIPTKSTHAVRMHSFSGPDLTGFWPKRAPEL